MFEILCASLNVILFALFSALFAWLLYFCLGDIQKGTVSKGRIFGKLGAYILKKYFEREEELEELDCAGKPMSSGVNWWKARGACPTCTNVWLAFLQYPIVAWFLFELDPLFTALYLIPFVVVSNGIARKLF